MLASDDYNEPIWYQQTVFETIDDAQAVPLRDFKAGYKQAIIDGKTNYSRPKGEWIEHSNERGSNWEYSVYECSECHTWQDDDSNYCGNCGADMIGRTDEWYKGRSICDIIDNAPPVETYSFEQVRELVKLNQQFAQEIENLKRPQGEREFIELEVKYLPDDITPTDYRGKPYYSIHYKENGEEFVGFGTYKLEVLSRYLKENFMIGGAE